MVWTVITITCGAFLLVEITAMASETLTIAAHVPVLSDGEDMRLLADQAIAVDPSNMEASQDSKVLKAYTVFENPKITVIPNFLKDCEMQHLLDLAANYWVPSTVGSGVYKTSDESKDLQNKQSKTRTSYSCMLKSGQTETVQRIEQKLANLAGLEVKYLERLNMVRYSPGQLFNRHHDGRFRPKTVFVYLNDLLENDGGETFFPDLGLKFIPRKGAAVMWSNVHAPGVEDNRTIHLGMPPKTSTKYGVNCFFNEKPLREWEAANAMSQLPGLGSLPLRRVDPTILLQENRTVMRPGQLRAFVLSEDPKIRIIPQLVSNEEVEALIALVSPEKADVQVEAEIFAQIEDRIAAAACQPLQNMEPLKVAKCTPDMTPDGIDLSDQEYLTRFGTTVVFLFLNDPEAADLRFSSLGLEVAASTACAVVWSTTSPSLPVVRHQAQPPRTGTRLAAMAVFRDLPVRK